MTDEDIQKTRGLCEEVIDERIKSYRSVIKACLFTAGAMALILIPGWFFTEGKEIYRSLHSAAFPVTFKKDTVLITAYTKDFELSQSGQRDGYLKFYAEKGQTVKYLLTIENAPLNGSGELQEIYILVDNKKIAKIKKFGGDFKILKLSHDNSNPEYPNDIHSIAFAVNPEQPNVSPKQVVYITCLIHVYGKQYEL